MQVGRGRALGQLLTVLIVGTLAGSASADEYNYQNLLIGTRSAGMGGADVAFADSVTGAYSNPAGIAAAPTRLVSVSLSAYRLDFSGFADIRAAEGHAGSAAGFQFTSFPLSFGLITRLGDTRSLEAHTLALNFFVVDNNVGGSRVDVRVPGVADPYLRVLRQDNETIEFGGSWAARHGPVSLGVGGAYRLRVESLLVDSLVRVLDSVTYQLRDVEALHGALLARAGVALTLRRGLRLGLAVTSPGVRVHSTAVVRDSRLRAGVMTELTPGSEGAMAYRTPWKAALGAGLQLARGARVAADVALHSPIARYEVVPGVVQAEGRVTVNANAGFELPVLKKYIVRAGCFTNFAATPSPSGAVPEHFDDPTRLPHMNYYGATVGLSMVKGSSSLDLTANYQYGDGKVPAQTARGYDPLQAQVVVLMVGGTYSFAQEAQP